jgi:hypothetical protein
MVCGTLPPAWGSKDPASPGPPPDVAVIWFVRKKFNLKTQIADKNIFV